MSKRRKNDPPLPRRGGTIPHESIAPFGKPPSNDDPPPAYVSRGGLKLAAALDAFQINPRGLVCADLGCNAGGFTDCLLRRGARCVYAIDKGKGQLDARLRRDERVVVMEGVDALHVRLPQSVDLVAIDVGWTRQRYIVPAAATLLKPDGRIVSLLKPHYEAGPRRLKGGVLDPADAPEVLQRTLDDLVRRGFEVTRWIESPITGDAGNREFLALIRPRVRGSGPSGDASAG